jgi:hypothetical protein
MAKLTLVASEWHLDPLQTESIYRMAHRIPVPEIHGHAPRTGARSRHLQAPKTTCPTYTFYWNNTENPIIHSGQ